MAVMASAAGGLDLVAMTPLYAAWEEPCAHRLRGRGGMGPVRAVPGRRPSARPVVNSLRGLVGEWRHRGYAGVSATTRLLLNHWFESAETARRFSFRQREAVETLIFLKELWRADHVSQILAEFGAAAGEAAANVVSDEEDAWPRAALRMGGGVGASGAMALCIAWSFFHARREPDSPLPRYFLLAAPGPGVAEALRVDFAEGRIFDALPIIPPDWRGLWQMSFASARNPADAAARPERPGGVIYLTGLADLRGAAGAPQASGGPPASGGIVGFRDRVAAHPSLMVLLAQLPGGGWPGAAWAAALDGLHHACKARGGRGIVQQLDLSCSLGGVLDPGPPHMVCESPLGEAVDGGLVKFPVIALVGGRTANGGEDDRWEERLRIGYERWKASREEWAAAGRKAIMVVLCEGAAAAETVAVRLNKDPARFPLLFDRTLYLPVHKTHAPPGGEDGRGAPWSCVVTELGLRDVAGLPGATTIVPLRHGHAGAGASAAIVLASGWQRMLGPLEVFTVPGGVVEALTVVDGAAFTEACCRELELEGVFPQAVEGESADRTTVDIRCDADAANAHFAAFAQVPGGFAGRVDLPYKATPTRRNPCRAAAKSPFTLVPCRRGLEAEVVSFLDRPGNGVAAFMRNAGPGALHLKYDRGAGRSGLWAPAFLVRDDEGVHYLLDVVEGDDPDATRKARAALAWCESAGSAGVEMRCLRVSAGLRAGLSDGSWRALVEGASQQWQELLGQADPLLPVAPLPAALPPTKRAAGGDDTLSAELDELPPKARKAAEEARLLFNFLRSQPGVNIAPAFQGLLGSMDEASRNLLIALLRDAVPVPPQDQRAFFDTYLAGPSAMDAEYYQRMARNLRKTLLYDAGRMPIGLLRDCLDYALTDPAEYGGIFTAVRAAMRFEGASELREKVAGVYAFRNRCVAHQSEELTDPALASTELSRWVDVLRELLSLTAVRKQAGEA